MPSPPEKLAMYEAVRQHRADGKTYKEIAGLVGISPQRCQQIVRKKDRQMEDPSEPAPALSVDDAMQAMFAANDALDAARSAVDAAREAFETAHAVYVDVAQEYERAARDLKRAISHARRTVRPAA